LTSILKKGIVIIVKNSFLDSTN